MEDNTGSDYYSYQIAKDMEGGLHTGRSQPSKKLLWTAAAAIVLLILGIAALALISTK